MKTGFTSLLAIVFIALKLTNHITWSWVWVLSPFWISIILVVIITILLKAVEKKESLRRVEEIKKRLKL
jgi:MFS family permease